MTHAHVVVWIDHREAHIIGFGISGLDRKIIRAGHEPPRLHHKANSIGDGRAPQDRQFLADVTTALEGASAILIVGPATAKMELAEYIRANNSALARAIEGVETVNHPTEGELLNLARSFFKHADRLPG